MTKTIHYKHWIIPYRITHYYKKEPDTFNWSSDWDCQGYTEIEWEVVDKSLGSELQSVLSDQEWERIREMIIEEIGNG